MFSADQLLRSGGTYRTLHTIDLIADALIPHLLDAIEITAYLSSGGASSRTVMGTLVLEYPWRLEKLDMWFLVPPGHSTLLLCLRA